MIIGTFVCNFIDSLLTKRRFKDLNENKKIRQIKPKCKFIT